MNMKIHAIFSLWTSHAQSLEFERNVHETIWIFPYFSCLFVCVQIYELLVLETKPGNAVSIIECDMQVLILFSEVFFLVWCVKPCFFQ